MILPGLADFLIQAKSGLLVPVYRDILADVETPLAAYWKLAHGETNSFLLESVTGGEQVSRYSFIGVRPKSLIQSSLGTEDILDRLGASIRPALQVEGMPKFVGGAVGFISYDLVRKFESLPSPPLNDLDVDDLLMMISETVIVFDHAKNVIRVIVSAEPNEAGYGAAVEEIEAIIGRLRSPLPELPSGTNSSHPVTSNQTKVEFESAVRRIIEYIGAGDCIQTVYSQRFERPTEAHPVAIYRALRSLNPSPYMFLLRFDGIDLIGASPEILVTLEGSQACVRPIAGTRPRASTATEDKALEQELLADKKELAEHIMLVDLGRNDLGRVCEPGTVEVNALMSVERYSHVMHIVSDVSGQLAQGRTFQDLIRATFPAGTVSGAPKVRAMQIIDELEPTKRGTYAGAIGYVGSNGDMDLCIAIRTILLKGGIAYCQAGAGIVFDSVPEQEFEETLNKAKACLRAIELAEQGLD